MTIPVRRTILGIDPGTNRAGYGVLVTEGNRMHCTALGIIDLHRIRDPYEKLGNIFERICELIDRYGPDEVALESPFFGQNVQSMLKLGRAQGVAMAAALHRGVRVYEYAPRRIKQSITGLGGASKEQVAGILRSLLGIERPEHLDATDGLAAAVCHYFAGRDSDCLSAALSARREGKSASWEGFLADHPERIVKPNR